MRIPHQKPARIEGSEIRDGSSGSGGCERPVDRIATFVRKASFETVRVSAPELAEVRCAAPQATRIYVSAVPTHPLDEQVETARQLHAAGFEPVPHLAVRSFASGVALDGHLGRLIEAAAVRRVLVIGGDRADPAGSLRDALGAIESGILKRRGIAAIGLAGYPEGHPRIPAAELDRALAAKIRAAENAGIEVHIVTQFCLSAAPIIAWIRSLRARGVEHPVYAGFAGPSSISTLLRFARICGVKASAQNLTRNIGLAKNLLASAPDVLVRALSESELGVVTPHFFSFGDLAAATRWAQAVTAGRIALARRGFEILK